MAGEQLRTDGEQVAARGREQDTARGGSRAAVVLLCLAQFVDVLGVTVVVTALPSMLADLHAPASAAALVVTGYAMLFGGLLMLGARLGDRFGHRRVLLGGLAMFAGGSLLAATAGSVVMLVVARSLQGAAAAVSVPAALRLLSASAPDEAARRRALAWWSASGAAAGASGFLLGGLVTQVAGWRTVFWLNVPLALLIAVGLHILLPADRGAKQRLDIAGAVLLTEAVMAAVAGASLTEQPGRLIVGLLLIAAAAVLAVAFARTERRVVSPLIPGAAVRHSHLRVGAAGAFLNTATTSSAMALASLELRRTYGAGPAEAGLLFLPLSILVIVGSALATRVLRRWRPPSVIGLGLGLIAVGDAALMALHVGLWVVAVSVAVTGLGLGFSSVASNTLGTDVPEAFAGTAAGVLNTAAQVGSALGIAAPTGGRRGHSDHRLGLVRFVPRLVLCRADSGRRRNSAAPNRKIDPSVTSTPPTRSRVPTQAVRGLISAPEPSRGRAGPFGSCQSDLDVRTAQPTARATR